VPVAVTAILADELDERGVRQAGDITAPSRTCCSFALTAPSPATFTLRGVTTQDFSQNQISPVAMYVDEVYKSVGAVQALQSTLDRVESAAGPHRARCTAERYRRAISFYSRNPSLSSYDGYLTSARQLQ